MAEAARRTGASGKQFSARIKQALRFERLFGLALLALLLVLYVLDPAPLQTMRLKLFDYYQTLLPREVTVRPVTIIDIDEDSLQEYGQWPWPRTLLADLVEKTFSLGAVLVAFDVVFPEPDRMNPESVASVLPGIDDETRKLLLRLPSNDELFASAISKYPVVLAWHGVPEERLDVTFTRPRSTVAVKRTANALKPEQVAIHWPAVIRNIPIIDSVGTGHGFISLAAERDGIVRRVPGVVLNEGVLYPAMAMEMMRVAVNRRAILLEMNEAGMSQIKIHKQIPPIPTDRNGQVWPHFSLPDHAKYVSAASVLNGTADPAMFKGKLVIVGTSAFGLFDLRAIPTAEQVPGVEVHAQVVENAFTDSFLLRPNYMLAVELTALLVGGSLLIWLVPWVGAKWSGLLFIAMAGGALAGAWYLFTEQRVLFGVGYLILSLLLIYTVLTFAGYASEEASRRRVRTAFSHYLAPAMVEKLADDPAQLVLGGETRSMSILFCDVRGFTTISETFKGNPAGLTHLINKLLTPLTAVILEREGTVDKYMGDCIMAFWNAPLDDPRHARNACLAAMQMQAEMGAINDHLAAEAAEEGRDYHRLAIGVGVNTGDVVVGNMGSDQRFDYSVLGDDVNLASRLEGQSKGYGVGIVIGENTRSVVDDMAFLELDLIMVKGKREAVRIFTLVGDETVLKSNAFPVMEGAHRRLLEAYRAQRWAEARVHLEACKGLTDGFDLAELYDVYGARIEEFEAAPPGADWDGVYVAATK